MTMTQTWRASVRRKRGLDPLWVMRPRVARPTWNATCDLPPSWVGYDFGGQDSAGVTVIHPAPESAPEKGGADGVSAEPVRARRTDQEPPRPRKAKMAAKVAIEEKPVSACTRDEGEASAPKSGGAEGARIGSGMTMRAKCAGVTELAPAREPLKSAAPKKAPTIDWGRVANAKRAKPEPPAPPRKVVSEETPLPERAPRVVVTRAGTNREPVSWKGTRWCSQCDMRVTAPEVNGCGSQFCKAPRA